MVQSSFAGKRANAGLTFFANADVTLPDGRLVRAQLSKLSSVGCYIDMLEAIPVGTELHLRISDSTRTCETYGKVIYAHSAQGMGIFGVEVLFGKMDAGQRSAISAWLSASSPQAP